MADVNLNLRGVAKDLVSAVGNATKSFRGLGASVDDAGEEAITTERDYAHLGNAIHRQSEFALSATEANNILKESIERVGDEAVEGVYPLDSLRDTVRELGMDSSTIGKEGVRDLEQSVDNLFDAGLGARISVDKLDEIVEELGESSDASAGQVAFLERVINDVADGEDRASIQRLNQELQEQIAIASGDKEALREVNQEFREMLSATAQADLGLSSNQAQLIGLERSAKSLEDVIEELNDELLGVAESAGPVSAGSLIISSMFELVAESADDAEEEVREFNRALRQVLPENPATTLNLGPLNLSLSQLGTTIISLTVVLGPLLMAVTGLATGFIILAGAVGAFLGAGLFGFLEQIESQFAGINDRMEAMEALASGLMEALSDAFAPIFEGQIAGQTPIQFFVSTIQGALGLVRQFAEIFSEIAQMEVFAESLEAISDALSTGDSGPSMLETLKEATEALLPIVTDVIVFLINTLPDFIEFVTGITERVVPALASIFFALLPVMIELIKFGTLLFEVISVLVSGIFNVIGLFVWLFEILDNKIPLDLGGMIAGLAAAIIITVGVMFAFVSAWLKVSAAITTTRFTIQAFVFLVNTKLIPSLTALIARLGTLTTWLGTTATSSTILSGAFTTLSGAATTASTAVRGLIVSLAALGGPVTAIVVAVLAVVAAIAIIVEWFIGWGNVIDAITEKIHDLVAAIKALNPLSWPGMVMEFLAGFAPSAPDAGNGRGRRPGRSNNSSGGNRYNVTINNPENPNRTARKTRNVIREKDRRDAMRGV